MQVYVAHHLCPQRYFQLLTLTFNRHNERYPSKESSKETERCLQYSYKYSYTASVCIIFIFQDRHCTAWAAIICPCLLCRPLCMTQQRSVPTRPLDDCCASCSYCTRSTLYFTFDDHVLIHYSPHLPLARGTCCRRTATPDLRPFRTQTLCSKAWVFASPLTAEQWQQAKRPWQNRMPSADTSAVDGGVCDR